MILNFIAGAERSLDIAVQEIDNEAIAQAILDARFRGVSVRMVLEQFAGGTRFIGAPP